MDKEFIEKMDSISAWHETEDKNEQAEFELEFSNLEEGLVTLIRYKSNLCKKSKDFSERLHFALYS